MPRPKSGQEPRPGGKVSNSYRLSQETVERVRQLAAALHVTQGAVLELAVRLLAKREGMLSTTPEEVEQQMQGVGAILRRARGE